MPGASTSSSISAATLDYKQRAQPILQNLGGHGGTRGGANVALGLLEELLQHTRAVEAAAMAQDSWKEEQVAWCLTLIRPLLTDALWCCSRGGKESKYLILKCELLFRIVASWEHTERLGCNHLRNLYLLWSALVELCALDDAPHWHYILGQLLASPAAMVPDEEKAGLLGATMGLVGLGRENSKSSSPSPTRSTSSSWIFFGGGAQELSTEALKADVQVRLEQAFSQRFGVGASYLELGQPSCTVNGLLRTLQS